MMRFRLSNLMGPKTKVIVGVIVVAIATMPHLSSQDFRPDEVQEFFGKARPKPSAEQTQRIETLWRKAQIGARADRLTAATSLVEFGSLALGFLEGNLSSGSAADVRKSALVLGRSGDLEVARKIRAALFDTEKTGVARRHLALALGLLGNRGDVEPLIDLLKSNRRNDFRRSLVHSLGQLRSEAAIGPLSAQYAKDKSQAFRRAVLLACGQIGGENAIALIRKALRSNKESIRRSATIAGAALHEKSLIPDFKKLLKDSDDLVARYALIGLGVLSDPGVGQAIKKTGVARSGNGGRRALAITALGMQKDALSAKLLAQRGRAKLERHLAVRRALAFALVRRPESMTAEAQRKLNADRDPDVARSYWCATAVKDQGAPGLVLEKLIFLKGTHDRVRLTLLELLAYHDGERAELVFQRIKDERRFKKKVLARSAELLEILQRNPESHRIRLGPRIQVEIDDLMGSPEWNLLAAIHNEFLDLENISRSFGASGGGAQPGGPPSRRLDPWTNEDEDLRMWFDQFPYYDRRRNLDVRP